MTALSRLARAGGVASIGVMLAFTPVNATLSGWLLAAALLVGLPHGALDHELHPEHQTLRGQAAWHLGYLVVVLCILVAWVLAPTAALVLFVAVSTWHFGQSDLLHAPQLRNASVVVVSRGALVVVAPLLAEPEVVRSLLASTDASATWLPSVGQPSIVVAALAIHVLALLFHAGVTPRFIEHATDAFALALLMTGAGTALGLAVYFVIWHTPDHFTAMNRTAWDTARSAFPRTLAAVGLLVAGALLVAPEHWPRLMVVSIAALSIPHALVVHMATPVHLLGARPTPEMEAPT